MLGQLTHQHPLAKHTSWHVGGTAEHFYRPHDLNDLATFLNQLSPNEPLLWLGLGSNLLVRDGGVPGTTIATLNRLKQIETLPEHTIRAEAGVTCAKLAKHCARAGFESGTFFAGIPGTVGGALAMNAGAFGGETWDSVIAVETIDRTGTIRLRKPQEYQIHYRHVITPPNEWFVAGHFHFEPGDPVQAKAAITAHLKQRSQTQPIGSFNCGSVFRNPPNDHAARLIEAAGLKGYCLDGAQVSEKHANFIINHHNTTAASIEKLITHIQHTIKNRYNIDLTPEVHRVGVPQ
jgi:UDP-N-acetylmuramate dehydrogenase